MEDEKEAWSMTREEWNKNKKYYGINWYKKRDTPYSSYIPDWEMTEEAEIKAINDYIGTHKNVPQIIYNRLGKIEPFDYEDDRDWEFSNSEWIMQVKSNIKDIYKGGILWVEDAREAIIIGRRLGYREVDILTYIISRYIPKLYKIILKGKRIPNKYFKQYLNLRQSL